MRWFWTIVTGLAALIVWETDNIFLLRLSCSVLLIGAAITEAKKALAVPSTHQLGEAK